MKSLQLILAFFIFPLLISNNEKHEYYVSVTKVEYSKEQKSVQITSQIFIDDFEKMLRERYDKSITLNSKDETEIVDTYIERYLSDKLQVSLNGKSLNFKFLGKEYKDDITYCYLEIENVSEINTIQIVNQILFDVFTDQQNIVRLKLKNKNKSFLLTPSNDNCMLNFD